MSRKQIVWIAVFVVLLASGCKEAPPAAAPTAAAVVSVRRGSLASTLTVAGQFQAYQQVDLHAKVSGYIRSIKVDIGDLVHNGEVLATLEVPELADQLNGSQAEVQHSQSEIVRAQREVDAAKATYSALHSEYTRLAEAAKEKPGLIAQQELDDAQSKDQQAEAQIGVAQAALVSMQQQLGVSKADNHRYQTLTNYEQIVAPFTGVVTMRYADTGSLIQAGTTSDTQSMPVVQVAQSDLLRLRMPVPEGDVPYIHQGGKVQVDVNATGRSFTGTIVRFTRSLDTNTRTMLTEVDVPNPDLVLSPGMYAEATIQLDQKSDALILPAQAVVQSGDQIYVLVVNAANQVEKRAVTLGIQTANQDEIASGLREGERVIASGQTNYQAGETVSPHAAFIPTAAQEVGQ
jgi:RND family efflux transporter MFP subunit